VVGAGNPMVEVPAEVRSGRRLAAGPAVGAGKPMAEAPAGVRTGQPMAAGRAVVGAGKPMAEVPVRVRTGQPMVVDLAVVGARKPMAAGLAGIGGGQPMAEAMTTGGAGPSMAMVGASCRWCRPMRLNFSIPHPTAEKVTTRIPVSAGEFLGAILLGGDFVAQFSERRSARQPTRPTRLQAAALSPSVFRTPN
jgi:hypothetical protein